MNVSNKAKTTTNMEQGVLNHWHLSISVFDSWVQCIGGPSTCKGVSLRSINFENAFLGP
jgi:hypothetical protein